jgi:hypothetical protein
MVTQKSVINMIRRYHLRKADNDTIIKKVSERFKIRALDVREIMDEMRIYKPQWHLRGR